MPGVRVRHIQADELFPSHPSQSVALDRLGEKPAVHLWELQKGFLIAVQEEFCQGFWCKGAVYNTELAGTSYLPIGIRSLAICRKWVIESSSNLLRLCFGVLKWLH